MHGLPIDTHNNPPPPGPTPSTQRCITAFLQGEDLSYGAFKRTWAELDMGLVHFAAPTFTDGRLYLQFLYGVALALLAPTLRLPGGRIQLPTSIGWKVRSGRCAALQQLQRDAVGPCRGFCPYPSD